MRRLVVGLLFAVATGAAQAQDTSWGAFEDGNVHGVGIQVDGASLLLKCDRPGRNSVYALAFTNEKLVPPSAGYQMRSAELRFDTKPVIEDRWRFYEHYVVATNKDGESSLTRLLNGLGDAQTLELRLYPERGKSKVVTLKFNTAGAKDAITQVYQACGDTSPVG